MVHSLSKKQRLTQEQDEIRLRGLRILARMIARAHLDSLAGGPVGQRDEGTPGGNADREDPPHKDGEYVG